MRTKPAYLIIDVDRQAVVRSTQRWPTLYGGEIAVRVRLEVPDDLIPSGVYDIEIDDPDAIAVDATAVPIAPPVEEEDNDA